MRSVSFLRIIAFGSLLFVTSCATKPPVAEGTATLLDGYTSNAKRIYVLAQMQKTLMRKGFLFEEDHDEADMFQANLVNRLQKCDLEVKYRNASSTALPDAESDLIKSYSPDAVLTIQPNYAQTLGNTFISASYGVSITDVHAKKVVWRSELILNRMNEKSGKNLSDKLIQLMQNTHILPTNCLAD